MLDTTPITIEITRLISSGTTEHELLAALTEGHCGSDLPALSQIWSLCDHPFDC